MRAFTGQGQSSSKFDALAAEITAATLDNSFTDFAGLTEKAIVALHECREAGFARRAEIGAAFGAIIKASLRADTAGAGSGSAQKTMPALGLQATAPAILKVRGFLARFPEVLTVLSYTSAPHVRIMRVLFSSTLLKPSDFALNCLFYAHSSSSGPRRGRARHRHPVSTVARAAPRRRRGRGNLDLGLILTFPSFPDARRVHRSAAY